MEAIKKSIVASIKVIEVRITEDEIAVYEAALSYVLDTLKTTQVQRLLGASRDELEGYL